MLRKITLRCFRQHVNRTFNFAAGLNLLRGDNEGGKTTILEAITYALGGATALPEALDKIVTWDHKETELGVELEIELVGVTYFVKRSKGGCTLTSPSLEKPITGQKEVSAFFAELLGGSAKTLGMLLMASQSGLQDVITAGPGEVSQLVQKLGSMDIVDAVIETGAKELILGNEKVFADRVGAATDRLEAATACTVPEVDVLEAERLVTTAKTKVEEADMVISTLSVPAMEAAASNLNAGIARTDHVQALTTQHQTVMSECSRLHSSIATATAVTEPDMSSKPLLQAELTAISDSRRRVMVKGRVEALMAVKRGQEWDASGPEADAEAELRTEIATAKEVSDTLRAAAMAQVTSTRQAELEQERRDVGMASPFAAEWDALQAELDAPFMAEENKAVNEKVAGLIAERRGLETIARTKQVLSKETCPTCGQKFADAESRAAHAAAENQKVTDAQNRLDAITLEIDALNRTLDGIIVKLDERKTRLMQARRDVQGKDSTWKSDRYKVIDTQLAQVKAELSEDLGNRMKRFNEKHAYLVQLETLLESGRAAVKLADELEGNPDVQVMRSVYPPLLKFIGVVSTEHRNEAIIRNEMDAVDAAKVRYDQAQGMLKGLQTSFEVQAKQAGELEAQIFEQSKLLPDMSKLREDYNKASEGLSLDRNRLENLKGDHSLLSGRLVELKGQRARAILACEAAKVDLALAQRQLSELAFNNEAMKAFKTLKPMITEHMWSKSLNVISSYFSDLRDQVVKVTREGSEFMFNGRPATSLSGSGKDILAIAIRAALTRTFLPNVGFMSLDEPAHGSDEVRTSRILGFLAKSGFGQIILASHDPLSESVADNIIYVTGDQ